MSIGTQQFWFNYNNASSTPVLPNALIQAWYDALAVKPSNPLTTALNELSQGLDDDGNWSKLDLFGLIAGMETQEQQLKPLITTSGEDFVIGGTPVLNANGVSANGGAGYLNLKWNPTDDGAQYTLNSAFISSWIDNPDDTDTNIMGYLDSGLLEKSSLLRVLTGIIDIVMNYDGISPVPTISNGVLNYYSAAVLDSGSITGYKNAVTASELQSGPNLLGTFDFFGIDLNVDGLPESLSGTAFARHFMAGSGTTDQLAIQTRLNTYYAARGL